MTTTPIPDRRRAEHSPLTPAERSQRARLAALSRHANTDGSAATQAAREAFLARFEEHENPEAARRAHFQRMAYLRHRK